MKLKTKEELKEWYEEQKYMGKGEIKINKGFNNNEYYQDRPYYFPNRFCYNINDITRLFLTKSWK